MAYIGDLVLGDTFDVKFTTIASTGAPITLAGSPVISAYPGNSTTQLTAGITLSVDFDGVTGLHNIRVVASSGNGYATATNYALVITTGTVDSVSVVGYVVAHFSIENRVLNAAKIATDAFSAAKFAADCITAAKIADGAIDANTFAAGAITASAIAADAIGASELAADAVTEIQSGLATAAALATVDDFLDTEIAAILAAVDTEVGDIKTKTDQLTFTTANQVDANVQSINDTALQGDGSATPWGPV